VSHCVGRVSRLKGASRVGGFPDLSGLASSGVIGKDFRHIYIL